MIESSPLPGLSITVQIIYTPDYDFDKWGPIEPKTSGSAGFDMRACILNSIHILPGQTVFINTGIKIHIDDPRYMAVLYSRSGLGTKKGGVIAQGAGIIDSDYQGPIMAAIWNRLDRDYSVDAMIDVGVKDIIIEPGELIAQLIFQPVVIPTFTTVFSFEATVRGEKGFGHTGKGI